MTDQLTFDLPTKLAFGREDFFVSEPNELAVRMIENWQSWPSGKLLLIGPKGSGKSHLASIWKNLSGAFLCKAKDIIEVNSENLGSTNLCFEDCENLARNSELEEAMFHQYNLSNERQSSLLLTSNTWPKLWRLQLADLESRIGSITVAELKAPDDAMLGALLIKQFSDKQLQLDPKVINFLLPRMERSFETVSKLVENLDTWSLREKRPITVSVAKKILSLI